MVSANPSQRRGSHGQVHEEAEDPCAEWTASGGLPVLFKGQVGVSEVRGLMQGGFVMICRTHHDARKGLLGASVSRIVAPHRLAVVGRRVEPA